MCLRGAPLPRGSPPGLGLGFLDNTAPRRPCESRRRPPRPPSALHLSPASACRAVRNRRLGWKPLCLTALGYRLSPAPADENTPPREPRYDGGAGRQADHGRPRWGPRGRKEVLEARTRRAQLGSQQGLHWARSGPGSGGATAQERPLLSHCTGRGTRGSQLGPLMVRWAEPRTGVLNQQGLGQPGRGSLIHQSLAD